MVFTFGIILSLSAIFSSDNWFMIWCFMEILFLFFLCFYSSNSEGVKNLVPVWVYFIINIVATTYLYLYLSMIFSDKIWESPSPLKQLFDIIFVMSVLVKMGNFPFHSWVISLSEDFHWKGLVVFNSAMKLPLVVVLYFIYSSEMLLLMIFIISTSSFICFYQPSLKRFIIISSIINFNWVIFSIFTGKDLMTFFFINYVISLMCFLFSPMKMNLFEFSNFIFSWTKTPIEKFILIIMFLNITAFPPSSPFFMKLKMIYFSSFEYFYFMLVLLMGSIFLFTVYLTFFISMNFKGGNILEKSSTPFFLKKSQSKYSFLVLFLSLLVFMPLPFTYFFM